MSLWTRFFKRKPESQQAAAQHWLEMALEEVHAEAHTHGCCVAIACGACRKQYAFREAVPGWHPKWPHCPVHGTPMMVVSIEGAPCHVQRR